MYRLASIPLFRWSWRGLAGLALLLGLVLGPAAYADGGTNRITLYAPSAPSTAWTVVQFQTPDGAWHDVTGWEGALDTYPDTGLRYKAWTVATDNADQGPFRWVVYTSQGGAVWGVSDSFDLPGGVDVNLEATVQAAAAATTTTTTTSPAPTAAVTPAAPSTDVTSALPVTSDASAWYFDCLGCNYSLISVYLPDAPIGSAVGVQYQLPDGTWHDVAGWQTTLAANDNGAPYVVWSVAADNFGQGPFRWVITQPDGTLWGVSAKFNLPTEGLNYMLYLLRA